MFRTFTIILFLIGPLIPSPASAKEELTLPTSYWALFGAIEGATEFLPISSTGHLLIAERLLNLSLIKQPSPALHAPATKEPKPYTLREALSHYFVVIQGGAILAVLVLYRRFFYRMWRGFLQKDRAGRALLHNLLLAFIPAATLGLIFNKWIHQYLFSMKVIAWGFIVGAGIMILAEKYRVKLSEKVITKDIESLPLSKSLLIGSMQCLALWPGMSRSMTTIVGGYLVGMPRQQAAIFSFLLGAVTLLAAAGYELFKEYHHLRFFNHTHLLLGVMVAFIVANITIRWFINYLGRHGLLLFAFYRIILGVLILFYFK